MTREPMTREDYSDLRLAHALIEDHLAIYPDRSSAMLRGAFYRLQRAVERHTESTNPPGDGYGGQYGEIGPPAASQEAGS